MGYLRARGPALTLDARDTHAWAVRSWSGVNVLELPPKEGRGSSTVDVFECELTRAAHRPLHHGWR